MSRPLRTLALAAAAASLFALPVLGDGTASVGHVVYMTAGQVYVDAGTDAGLALGDRLAVQRDGRTIEVLEVLFLASQHALCEPLIGKEPVEIGDAVLLHPDPTLVALPDRPSGSAPAAAAATPESSSGAAAASGTSGAAPAEPALPVGEVHLPRRTILAPDSEPEERPRRRTLRELGIRGRVGLRYLAIRDRSGADTGFHQPALDLRLDGRQIAGTPYDVNVDVRARRTYRSETLTDSGTDSRTRVYRLAAAWTAPGIPVRVSVGRQFSSALSTVSIFDGALAEYTGDRWSVGAFTGTQPDLVDFGYSTAIREYGAYYQIRALPRTPLRWSVTTGLIGSYENGEINREFAYVQALVTSRKLSIYATEEIDVNRGWKSAAGESSFSPTNTFLMARYRLTDDLSFDAGYDNRRNVRLYRDRVTPETEFDDSYRQGVWVGGSYRFLERYRVGLSLRGNSGGSAGAAQNYTVTFSANRLTPLNMTMRTRTTRYSNDLLAGWLHSVSAGADLWGRYHFELSGGLQQQNDLAGLDRDETLLWYGVDLDIALGRHWYLLLSLERNDGDVEKNDQIYTSLTYRF